MSVNRTRPSGRNITCSRRQSLLGWPRRVSGSRRLQLGFQGPECPVHLWATPKLSDFCSAVRGTTDSTAERLERSCLLQMAVVIRSLHLF